MTTADLAALIRGHRFRYINEDQLQEGIAAALWELGIEVKREVQIDKGRSRLDLLCERIGVEVKVKAPTARVLAQVARYLRSDALDGMVVVTVSPKHTQLPKIVAGKPLEVVTITAGGL